MNPLIAKLERRDHLSQEEREVLERAAMQLRSYGRGEDMVVEGERPAVSTLLLEGFAARYKVLLQGRRRITALHVAGDFVDLHGFVLKRLDHSIVALTPCRVASVPHEVLRDITDRHPHLTRLLWLSTAIDGAIHRQWLAVTSSRPALGQAAHLVCELFLRLQVVGLTTGKSFRLPLTQAELGDTLGLSTVHVNRVVQEMRAAGLLSWRDGILTVENWDGLVAAAEFDAKYLNLESEPR